MNQRLKQIFKKAVFTSKLPLTDGIWVTIVRKQKQQALLLTWGYSFAGALSFFGLIFVTKDILTKFAQSGLYDYLSLLSSDGKAIVSHWKEFTLSITESLPLTSITVSLFLLFVILISARRIFRQYKGQLLTAY